MAQDRPTQALTAEQFLTLRHQLAEHDSTSILEKFDEELEAMAASDPDRAASILQALTDSSDRGDRDTAAVYVKHLFATRPEQAREIIVTLLRDTDDDVRSQALDVVYELTSDHQLTATEAAQLATNTAES